MPPQKQPSFADAFAELEAITKWFERDDVDIEEGLKKFERGMTLAKALRKRLQDAETTIKKLQASQDSEE